jgi:serralysin
MAKGSYADFFSALGQNESGNNYSFVSSLGYLGRFQFGEEALQAVGFYQGDHTSSIDFVGGWTEISASHGAWDKSSFLNAPAAQDAAAYAWFDKIDDDLNSLGLRQYEGQWMSGGVQITDSGLLAGAHLVGVWALKSYLESGGQNDTRDGYGTPVSEYVHRFGGYDTPFKSGPAPQPPGDGGSGQVLVSDQYADVLTGGAGADTLHAGRGPDQLTGGAGADAFVFRDLPWNAGAIGDFTPGADKLDLSAIFDAAGYWGDNPMADGMMRLEDVGGATRVHVDVDGPNGGEWPFLITTLTGVSPGSLSSSDWIV